MVEIRLETAPLCSDGRRAWCVWSFPKWKVNPTGISHSSPVDAPLGEAYDFSLKT